VTESLYRAPADAIAFTLETIAGLESLLSLPTYRDFSPELVNSILAEAAKFAEGELSPLNRSGDRQGCKLNSDGSVSLPDGFETAYQRFVEGGWNAAPFPADHGGMGLPAAVNSALQEMWHGANLSFALIPLLTQSGVHVLSAYGNDWQKSTVLPKLVSGEWSGTMCITEPQAGSDVGASRTVATPASDGTYRIKGSKIFISAGEHEASGNIIHLVLARLPDAPAGTKGLSLFLVPKLLINADGSLGARNDLRAVSLEHKLGMHGSVTAVMSFGDNEGAIGTLVGQPNEGIKAMFVMMNAARIGVGLQGLGIAEAAAQVARRYAEERVQSRAVASAENKPVAIIHHPDVQRMLGNIESHTQGLRALAAYMGSLQDIAAAGTDEKAKKLAQARVDLLTPVMKSHTTQKAFDIASETIQIHGGMGFIEETGVAQFLRDVRVTMIYEGTNGIQALDLVLRKLAMDDGETLAGLLDEINALAARLKTNNDYRLLRIGGALAAGAEDLKAAGQSILTQVYRTQSNTAGDAPAAASAAPFLTLFGLVMQAFLLAKGAEAAAVKLEQGNAAYSADFLNRQIGLAEFFTTDPLLDTASLRERVRMGNLAVKALFD